MKKTNKKALALSKTTIKQLSEVAGAAKNICTFGSTEKVPTAIAPTCISCVTCGIGCPAPQPQ